MSFKTKESKWVRERDKYGEPGHWLAFSKLDWSIPIPAALLIHTLIY